MQVQVLDELPVWMMDDLPEQTLWTSYRSKHRGRAAGTDTSHNAVYMHSKYRHAVGAAGIDTVRTAEVDALFSERVANIMVDWPELMQAACTF